MTGSKLSAPCYCEQTLSMPAQVEPQELIKTHAACDECRFRKLKCSGDRPSCARCVRESIHCAYSPQKQMGRPKKRPRADDEMTLASSADRTADDNEDSVDFDAVLAAPDWNPLYLANGSTQLGSETFDIALPDLMTEGGDVTASAPQSLLPSDVPVSASTSSSAGHPGPTLTEPSCACLSTMYLTLDNLHSMDASCPFPFALAPLRQAMQATSTIIACEQCPKRCITMVQNTQSVGTLLVSLAERFARLLECIEKEAQRAEAGNETKKFRLTDLNQPGSDTHLGGAQCMAAFNIDMSPSEWRSLAKRVVRSEACGPVGSDRLGPSMLACVEAMEKRQTLLHSGLAPRPPDVPRELRGNAITSPGSDHPDDYICLKMVTVAKDMISGLDWD